MQRLLDPIHRRIALAVGRAVLRAATSGGARVQVEALAGELLDDREHEQPYGFASYPLAGAKVVHVSIGGARNNTVAVVISDPRYRPEIEPGDTALHDHRQQIIHISADGIRIDTPLDVTVASAARLRVEGQDVEIHATASLKIDCGGYGETWLPTGRRTWTQGAPTVPMGPPIPPEHP